MTIVNQSALPHTQTSAIPAVIHHCGLPVVTTEILANLYGTEVINIQVNHTRNRGRFVEGKHFFKLEGVELKEFKNRVVKNYSVADSLTSGCQDGMNRLTASKLVAKRARSLILWTERGAARHAKMLETDQAWEVFEKLEDFYFNQKEKSTEVVKAKSRNSTSTQLTPLRQTAERLITTGLGRLYPDIWKLVHQRFDIEHINQLRPEQIGEAIDYLNALEGELMEPERQGIQPNYLVCVRIKDEITGGKIEFNLSAETVVSLVTGISTCLGYAPTGFNKVPVQKKMMRQIH